MPSPRGSFGGNPRRAMPAVCNATKQNSHRQFITLRKETWSVLKSAWKLSPVREVAGQTGTRLIIGNPQECAHCPVGKVILSRRPADTRSLVAGSRNHGTKTLQPRTTILPELFARSGSCIKFFNLGSVVSSRWPLKLDADCTRRCMNRDQYQ